MFSQPSIKIISSKHGSYPAYFDDYTLDKIDFSKLSPIAEKESAIVPKALYYAIHRAILTEDFETLKNIHDKIQKDHTNIISLKRIVAEFYIFAIACNYNRDEFAQLLKLFPIDINQEIHYAEDRGCTGLVYYSKRPIEIAADFLSKDTFGCLVEHGVLSDSLKNIEAQLQRRMNNMLAVDDTPENNPTMRDLDDMLNCIHGVLTKNQSGLKMG